MSLVFGDEVLLQCVMCLVGLLVTRLRVSCLQRDILSRGVLSLVFGMAFSEGRRVFSLAHDSHVHVVVSCHRQGVLAQGVAFGSGVGELWLSWLPR